MFQQIRVSITILFISISSIAFSQCTHGNCSNGIGTYLYDSGAKYVGEFKDGKINGKGILYFSNGKIYKGEWTNNYREGKGTLDYPDGAKYQGKFKKSKFNGFGVFNYRNGDKYEGNWKEDLSEGKGIYYFIDGDRYEGEFSSGKFHGNGTMYYKNGARYEGEWSKNKKHGKGIMYYHYGRILGGNWKMGTIKEIKKENGPAVKMGEIAVDKDPKVKIRVLIVGVANYNHMPALKYTDDDAYQVYAFYKSIEGGSLPDDQIKVLIDDNATRKNIIKGMQETFLKADDNDVIVMYFSGHGFKGSFIPFDYNGYTNLLGHDEIKKILEKSQAKHKLVLADACHSGSIEQNLIAARSIDETSLIQYYNRLNTIDGGMALLMSSKKEEYSLEDSGLRQGIFSHFLIRGLKGEANTDNDSFITINEISNYVIKNVTRYTNNAQNPVLMGKFHKEMPIAFMKR